MTDSHVTPEVPAQDASNKEADAVRAGAMLRAAREAAGVHIATLAGTLKVPLDKLQALENGDLAALPDRVFARALASSVCRNLKIDPAPVLTLLPRAAPGALPGQVEGINTPVKNVAGKSLDFSTQGKHRWLGWVVLVLLLGALALVFWPHGAPDSGAAGPKPASAAGAGASAASVPQAPQPQTPLTPSSTPGPVAVQTDVAQTPAPASIAPAAATLVAEEQRSFVSSASPTAAAPGSAPGGAGAAASAALAPSAAASAAADPVRAAPAAGADLLLLRARSASWVQVRDAAGKVVQERTLQAGEALPAAGTPPLAVVLGRADAVEVFVRGQPFAPPTVSKGNVARFEVK